jgi:hypothetical protein
MLNIITNLKVKTKAERISSTKTEAGICIAAQ